MVDFAYHVHTDVGNLMVGAKVNGKMVPSNHQLRNAEVVEVMTYTKEITAQDVLRHMVRPCACAPLLPRAQRTSGRVLCPTHHGASHSALFSTLSNPIY